MDTVGERKNQRFVQPQRKLVQNFRLCLVCVVKAGGIHENNIGIGALDYHDLIGA